MFDESTIREMVQKAERDGAPPCVACDLEADLLNVLFAHRRRMDRINRHTQILDMVSTCRGNVSMAADNLDMSREGIYKHLRKSTDTHSGVDTQAA